MRFKKFLATKIPLRSKKALKFRLYQTFGWKYIEEVQLISEILRRNKILGTILDVGSHTGGSASYFLNNGFDIHCFEPGRETFEELKVRMKGRTNVVLNHVAISEVSGQVLNFYESPESKGISSLHKFRSSHTSSYQVNTLSLTDYIEHNKLQNIVFLKIDVEGHEMSVLKSINLLKNRPSIILFEFEDSKTRDLGYGLIDLLRLMEENEYIFMISEWYPLKNYGDFHKWKGWKSGLNESLDPHAWGNVIAIDSNKLDAENILLEIKSLSNIKN